MTTTNLDTSDAGELAELLQFLHDWLAMDADRLGQSLSDFLGTVPTTSLSADRPQQVRLPGRRERRRGLFDPESE
jgi:hypothetical protein